ncbi:MAG: helix-turn-helix domain-containing protein [Chloroflexi bacterium]|nr:helix-turn-helix domain-containing protein [Chloroflexota bacterium]
MAKRQFQLSEAELRQLQQAEHDTRDAYELKRLQAVRLYGSGVESRVIETLVGCDERSIRKWAQRYTQAGLEGLRSRWQGENALKLSREQRADLKHRLHQYRPDQVLSAEVRMSQGQFWTVSDLHIVVKAWYAVEYRTPDSYRSLLQECGLSYQRTEKVYRSRPNAQTVADFEAELEKK